MLLKLKKHLTPILLSLLASLALPTYGTQLIPHADKTHQQAFISAQEQNRLAIAGRRIASVIPSQKGVISVIKDEALGALYFTLSNAQQLGSITLFVSDDAGATYKLILHPKSIPGEEIILQPSVTEPRSQATDHGSYQSRIKDLAALMAEVGSSHKVTINQEVKLWQESHFLLLSQYDEYPGLLGEKYRLTNISASSMELLEQEFYRTGVLAVAIEQHTLAPGESTHILIIRSHDV